MVKTAINLYSVRDLEEPLLEILDRVADAGYDGVQFSAGLRGTDPEAIRAKLESTGLEPTGAHVDIDDLEGDLESVHDRYAETLGCDGAVVPYLGADHFDSLEAVAATADRLAALATDASEHGWSIHYHNHAHEFTVLEGETAYDRVAARAPEVGLELDVGWALVGGRDPVALIDTYGDRIDLLHVKDMVTGDDPDFCEIGEGDVDVAACADAAREADVEWLVYEHDEPADPVASIETGAAVLESL